MTDTLVVTPNETEVVANATTTVVVASTPGGASIVETFANVAVASAEVIVVDVATSDPVGTAAASMAAHVAAADPHPGYLLETAFTWANVGAKPSTLAGFGITDAVTSAAFTWANIGGKPTTAAGFGLTLVAGDIPSLSWTKITTGKPTTLAGYGITDAIPSSQKAAANGVASLGSDGKVPTAQLPSAITGQVVYKGTWNATGAAPSAAPAKGDYYVVTVAGSTNLDGITDWKVGDWAIYNGAAWDKVDNTDAISSWNGRVGAITPAANDYTFAQIGSKPTTVAGYGITDAPTLSGADLPLSGAFYTSYANGFRITQGNFGAFWRNDGATFYLLFTASGDALGTWSALRPFAVNMTTGVVTFANGASFSVSPTAPTPAAADSTTKLATTAWVQGELNSYVLSSSVSSAAGNSTIVQRNASGFIYCNYINLSGAITATAASHVHVETATDGFVRRKTVANFRTQDMGIWVQSADPGASAADGDLWIW